jgi:hypothetical protein
VIKSLDAEDPGATGRAPLSGNRDGRLRRRQAHNIDFTGSHPAHIRCNTIAQLLPGVARRFPFSAVLWTRGEVFFRNWAAANGEILHDNQSQRAVGLDFRSRTFGKFRRATGDGRWRRYG